MLEVSKKSSFVGRSLRDDESSVIHHYAAPSALPNYPDVRAGFLLNGDAIRRAAKKYDPVAIAAANQFVIDTGYEFARWLVENCDVVLEHSEKFCVEGRIADPTLNKDCAVVAHEPRVCSVSERAHSNSDVHVAVKTYSGNHKTRLPVLRRTWLTNAPSFRLYSDITDDTYGTISTGVANTERGHCAKTLVILRLSLQRPQPWQWLLLVDDDTLVSMPRLLKTLSCYSPEEAVVLGEMYGYRAGPHLLVPYPTGGSGIVFSRPMVELLMESSWCSCRVPDEPDDMLLGMCLHRLGHSLVHLRDLHQATPSSYAAGRLNGSNPISFHGFWMIDPVKVYKKWLVGNYEEKPHRNRIVEKVNQATKSMNKDEL
ncbi:beta-1,3-glucosyltransferase [Hyalella azteca]|uniref:N-acetylgalactosaminide beta-1,3-galactosyltransferase n=1 Tax=Hyalella azteca TaxID=294128 RepID=A0A8B7PMU0_HYAAZ|nr:beta-1,3-glucosyltransferase [Hyalella azteca]